ncbi:B-cell antigen receptor complex-associated protein alpha chain isoform X2 [Bufo bufo]|uniref:B-cell antigen receptor complex-associated protein alpha chain isoform X2 n=1 Tax=Bufo bufo TaxID=8384 RepID=UPI001ABE7250|nr:B-cell antigen receptor complex-associated protein alpha chain isoform X2 [Bufo bufo]
MNAPHATWTAPIVTLLILLPVPRWALEMQWVPTSISILPGEDATIPCNFHRKHNENVNISWVLIQRQVNKTDDKSFIQMVQKKLPHAMRNLTIRNAAKTDSGIYLCRVTAGSDTKESCGTYLRVRELPVFLFFNVAEATKNRLITAEGIILLLCAIIPGTFLLYKRCHHAEAYKRMREAYSTAGKAFNDYTSLTGVELLAHRLSAQQSSLLASSLRPRCFQD